MKNRFKYPFFSVLVLSSIIYGEFKMLNGYIEKNDKNISIDEEYTKSDVGYSDKKDSSVVTKDSKESDDIYAAHTLESDEYTRENVLGTELDKNQESVSNDDTIEDNTTEPVTQTKAPTVETTEDKTYEFTTVDRSYLDGALFIGDSRTSTLYEYAGWDNTDFYVEYGLTIWDVLNEPIATRPGTNEKISVYDGLSATKYDKIYIMLGVNELGTGTADTYFEQFKTVIDTIRALQPDATVFIQSIIHVTDEIDRKGTYINNDEINARNEKIKTLADNKSIFYIDNNQLFDDPQTGKLNPDYTGDGVHILAKYVGDWQNFYLEHGIVK